MRRESILTLERCPAEDAGNGTRRGGESSPASQTSPGRGFIEQLEDLLFAGPRARGINEFLIGELDRLQDALPGLGRRIRLPLAQSLGKTSNRPRSMSVGNTPFLMPPQCIPATE